MSIRPLDIVNPTCLTSGISRQWTTLWRRSSGKRGKRGVRNWPSGDQSSRFCVSTGMAEFEGGVEHGHRDHHRGADVDQGVANEGSGGTPFSSAMTSVLHRLESGRFGLAPEGCLAYRRWIRLFTIFLALLSYPGDKAREEPFSDACGAALCGEDLDDVANFLMATEPSAKGRWGPVVKNFARDPTRRLRTC